MKGVVFREIGRVESAEVPRPEPGPGEVLIRVGYCGICGSDIEALHTGMYEPGLLIGHEFAGTIDELGEGVDGWQEGDRVVASDAFPCGECLACRRGRPEGCINLTMVGFSIDGAMAEYVKMPARELHRLPAAMRLRQAALVEPLAVVLHAVRRSRLRLGDSVLVMGAGPIGLLAVQCARLAGAQFVAATEVDGGRRALAERLGASPALDPASENVGVVLGGMTGGLGVDLVFVCTGAPAPFRDMVSLVRKGGQVYLLGLCTEPVEADFMSIVLNDLCLEGSLAGHADFPAAIDAIAQRQVDVEALVSHEIALDEIMSGGFERLAAPGSGAVKILVRIGGEG